MHITPKNILIYTLIATLALYIIENVYHPVYLIQIMQKVMTFLVIPLLIGYLSHRVVGRFGKINKDGVILGVSFGTLSALIIGLAYYFLQDAIGWEAIRSSANARGVDETNFLLAFAYIMFGNSLIEEYFFRGVVYRNAREISRSFAYILSALMFSLYHITIFGTWLSGYILGLALFGLFIGGLFFSWLYQKTGGIWGAWIFHIFADLTILVIGYIELFS